MEIIQNRARNTMMSKASLLITILKLSAGHTQQACQQLRVENEKYIKANGLYLISKDLKVSWDERKPVYKLEGNIDRVIFYNTGEGWCIGKEKYTRSGRYWYRLGKNIELGTNITWKTSLGKSNTTVTCVTDNKSANY